MNVMAWFDFNLIPWILLDAILCFFFICKTNFLYKFGILKKKSRYKTTQRLHAAYIPRTAGLIIYSSLFGYSILSNNFQVNNFLFVVLITFLPTLFFSFKEDIHFNVNPLLRISALFFSSLCFLIINKNPLPELPGIFQFNSLSFLIPLYLLGIVTMANGMNLIDGVNGLCGSVAISILCTLLSLASFTSDYFMMIILVAALFLIIPYFIFNYPFGLIFLGDSGAYLLGYILAIFTIIFMGRHPEISPLVGFLILIYPLTEVLFSILRRILSSRKIHKSDRDHLHTKIFMFLRGNLKNKKYANSLVSPFISLLWLLPPIMTLMNYRKNNFIIVSIFVFFTIYLIFYFCIKKLEKNND
jgi:UDP-N-acetylmuramyl pentapeptide phosphotransferase/UDP-N-acetylglucosamine-1-phosphate transferase